MLDFIRQALFRPNPKPETFRQETLNALDRLQSRLNSIADRLNRRQTDAVNEIVLFFRAVADFQDSNYATVLAWQAWDDQLAQVAAELNLHVVNAGRNVYGWNRTEPGQTVTDHDVFLGNIAGYWTKPIAYVKARRDDQVYYATMCRQAAEFMNGHISPMLLLIRRLREAITARQADRR